MKPTFDVKPGSPEFRLSQVDGSATVDVGLPSKFGGQLGPGWRAEKWYGRGWLEVYGLGVQLNRPGRIITHPTLGDVYECECVRHVRGRSRGERHLVVPGSTEYQIEWDTRDNVPTEGYVDLAVKSSGDLTWHKQLALTQEEINEGCDRPENVVNSYAIYGSQAGRYMRRDGSEIINYETGKFAHLYRSQLIDSVGNRIWLDQTAPLANPNRLRVYLDNDWLSGATYPVVLDPTFGYTSEGATSLSTTGSTWIYGCGRYYGATGTLLSTHWYGQRSSLSTTATFGIYADNGSDYPSTPLDAAENSNLSTTLAWYTTDMSGEVELSAETYYHLAGQQSDTYSMVWYHDTGSNGISKQTSGSYVAGSLPNPFPSSSPTYRTAMMSFYATVETGNRRRRLICGA